MVKDDKERNSSPHDQRSDSLGKLIDVLLCWLVALIESSLEKVEQFVEFAKLPARVRSVLSRAYGGRVLVVFLDVQS